MFTAAVRFAIHLCMRGIHAIGRRAPTGDLEVCSGETQFPAALIAANHFARQAYSREHLSGRSNAPGNRLSNPRTAHCLPIQRHTGRAMRHKMEFLSELMQQSTFPFRPWPNANWAPTQMELIRPRSKPIPE